MRLLNTKSLELQFFVPSHVPDYVILSHRWCAESAEECTFEDIAGTPISNPNSSARKKQGFSKIQGVCDLAARDGYSWIWIDSCCIDKSSSAELQEAINSMWNYYAESNICYVYMADVPNSEAGWAEGFHKSEWFTRGWTLQELIAPLCVEFYVRDWAPVGTKLERHKEIADITAISPAALVRTQEIESFSAAERLSWVAHRKVTREEDEAYSLLGLFGVCMPLLYGEGREKAFIRLQEVIYNSTADHSLFLFRYSLHRSDQPLLADSPTRFCERIDCTSCKSRGVQCLPSEILYSNVLASERWSTQAHQQIMTTVTPFRNEMSTILPLLDYPNISNKLIFFNKKEPPVGVTHIAILNHTLNKYMKGALCLLLHQEKPYLEVFRRVELFPALLPYLGELTYRLQRTKILICPGPNTLVQSNPVCTTFSINGDSFLVQAWTAKGGISHSILPIKGSLNTEFEIQTSKSENSKRSTRVSCQIGDSQDLAFSISLQLIRIDETWSIKEVFKIKQGKRSRKKHLLFRSSILADRCSLRLMGGKGLSVGLRRLPAACRARGDNYIPQHGYQIIIRYL